MLDKIRKRILGDLEAIPGGFRSDGVIKELIRCVLYGYMKEQGLIPVPEFRTPRYPEGPVDLAAVNRSFDIIFAFCSGPTVELAHVKSMERIAAERKIIITFSPHEKKVRESAFFLKKDIEHLYLHAKE